jgi:1,6-anhydro-N-acetylmuramate kinase
MEGLKTGIEPSVVKPLHELGMPAEAKEAALMAFLANEMILGHQFSVRGKNITLGKISLPD